MPNIILHASKAFLIIMMLSFVLGSLMGSLMVNRLMDSVWEYYEAINAEVLTLAISILVVIATATIGVMIMRVAKANPAESLRHE